MNLRSPLFISSVELIAHSVELFYQKNERKNKFIILHLANAIELILKDKLIILGKSIYEGNSNKTLNTWGIFDGLKHFNISIPEKPIMELLIDDRNTIQHRFGFPNSESVFFYLTHVISFFKRFLGEEYKLDLLDELKPYLKKEELELIGLEDDEFHQVNKLQTISKDMAILQIWILLEQEVFQILEPYQERIKKKLPIYHQLKVIIHFLNRENLIKKEIVDDFENLKIFRNNIAHGMLDNSTNPKTLEKYVEVGKEIIKAVREGVKMSKFSENNMYKLFDIEPL